MRYSTLGGCRYLPAKTLLKSLAWTALININSKSALRIRFSYLSLSVYLPLLLFLFLSPLLVREWNSAMGFILWDSTDTSFRVLPKYHRQQMRLTGWGFDHIVPQHARACTHTHSHRKQQVTRQTPRPRSHQLFRCRYGWLLSATIINRLSLTFNHYNLKVPLYFLELSENKSREKWRQRT